MVVSCLGLTTGCKPACGRQSWAVTTADKMYRLMAPLLGKQLRGSGGEVGVGSLGTRVSQEPATEVWLQTITSGRFV